MALAMRHTPLRLRFSWPPAHPKLKELWRRFGPAALGVGVLQISFVIDTLLASLLYDNAISYLQYANRFYQLPLALIGTALATVLLPHFARALEKDETAKAQNAFAQSVTGGVALALAATAGLAVLAEPLMLTLLNHGKFSADAAHAAAWAMVAYSLGLPGYILTKINSTAFFAMGDTRTPVKAAVFALGVNIIANLILMQFFGHVGIALATALSGWVNTFLLTFWLQKEGRFSLFNNNTLTQLGKAFMIALCITGLLLLYRTAVPYGEGFWGRFLWLGGAITMGLGVFGGLGVLLNLLPKKLVSLSR